MRFRIKAVRAGAIVETLLEAPGASEAALMARAQGLRVLSVAAQRAWLPVGAGRKHPFPVLIFTQQLATLLRAGLSLIDSLESLSDKEDRPEHAKVLGEVVRALHEGRPFSQALGEASGAFPRLYVALVQASERTGGLAETLARYAGYQGQVDEVRKKIVSASIYPALLLAMGVAVMLFLLAYVVPKFSAVYAEVGSDLPWLSQVLLLWGRFLASHWQAVAAGLGAAAMLCILAWNAYGSAERMWHALERLPAIRERVFLYQVGRFYRSLGMLLRGGIPIVAAMGMLEGLMMGGLRQRLRRVTARVGEGLPLSRALEESGLMTPVAMKMLRAGERSGNLGEMLERAADFYDEEMARWIDWFVKLFEPILMALIGTLIGVIVVLMYMPIFELANSIR